MWKYAWNTLRVKMHHVYVWHDSIICVRWLIHMCGLSQPYMWHDKYWCVLHVSFMRMTLLIHVSDMKYWCVWHNSTSISRAGWPIHVCDMTHSYVWQGTFTCETWIIKQEQGNTTHLKVWSYIFKWVAGQIHIRGGFFCKRALQKRQYSAKETYNFIDPTDRSHPIWDMTHLTETGKHDTFIYVTCSFTCVAGQIHRWDMTHLISYIYMWYDLIICVTWRTHMCAMTHPADAGKHDTFATISRLLNIRGLFCRILSLL